ncbi:cytochrome c oxidase subunit I [Anaerobacillus sp. MEB173]|uniref:cytochrome c oxidase subunit I n=1 Tax=Anaerobacillus sp. MEB173 TaxID=3383345 RepID=UPI003F93752D
MTTVDHKKIGIMYLAAGAFFFLVGGLEAVLMRIQLMYPEFTFVSGQTFNQLLTMHGTTMIFLAAMPLLFGFMNFIVPLQIGARDVAFPFVNALGFWLFFFGGILLNVSWFVGGAPEAGWTAYVPLASDAYTGTGVDYYVLGLQISGAGTLMAGINFLVTIINMRAPGMTMMRLPLFTWSTFVASALILFAFPALTVGLFLLMFERLFGANYFVVEAGGNVVIWQHLFWIFGHPEVYILILPAFGIISEVIATFSRKRLFGYSAMVFATVLIGFLGFMVWAHHMFTVGMGPIANAIFGVATMAIAVPTGIKIFNWLFTMWGGQIRFTTANLWAIGFIPTFVMGGVTGVMLAAAPATYQFHDTYFVVAHFHYVIIGGVVFGLMAGVFYWWPKMFNRQLNETLGKIMFWTFFIGFHMTFFVQHFLGVLGMQRRIFTYLDGQGFNEMNFISTIGAFLMSIGTIVFLINVVITLRAERAVQDPWDGRTLEWSIPTPVPEYNFAKTPTVRGLDAFWLEKRSGNKEMPSDEELGDIHMPSASILPFIMSLGLFVAAFGLIYHTYWIAIVGFVTLFGCMFIRSVKEDHGYHIPVDEIASKEAK